MFIKIEKILYHSLKKSGIKAKIEETVVLEVATEVIASVIGLQALYKVKSMKIENHVLHLACLTDLMAERCRQFEKKIIWELNLPFHRPVVAKIVVTV